MSIHCCCSFFFFKTKSKFPIMTKTKLSLLVIMLVLLCSTAMAQGLPSGYTPCAVSDMTAEWNVVDGRNSVDITFTTPTQISKYDMFAGGYVYQDMDADITKVVIQRMTEEFNSVSTVQTIDAPEKGATLSVTDQNVAYGTFYYRVLVYVGSTSSGEWNWDAIKKVVVGQVPADFTEETVNTQVDGKNVTITYTVPALSTLGEPMTMPMTCTIAEMTGSEPPTYNTLNTKTDAEPGATYTYTVQNVSGGNHTYALQASTVSGANNGIYRYCVNVFVGQDVPGAVQNAKAKMTPDGVLVTWEAPVRGQNNGDMGDVSAFTYKVVRKNGTMDPEGTVVASGISALEYLDEVSSDKERTFIYVVTAKNSKGEGQETFTNIVLVGPSNALPYVENFETNDEYGNVSFDNVWQKDWSGSFCTWYTTSGSFYVDDDNASVKAHQGNGFAYAMYSSWGTTNKWDALTTGHIDFSEAENPQLTLWLYDVAMGGSDMKFSVQTITNDVDVTTEYELVLGDAETAGWREIVVSLPSMKNAENGRVRLRVDANGTKCYAVLIDEMKIEDAEPTAVNLNCNDTASHRMYNLNGQQVNSVKKGLVIVDGKKYVIK